jgi:RecA-family ATPase
MFQWCDICWWQNLEGHCREHYDSLEDIKESINKSWSDLAIGGGLKETEENVIESSRKRQFIHRGRKCETDNYVSESKRSINELVDLAKEISKQNFEWAVCCLLAAKYKMRERKISVNISGSIFAEFANETVFLFFSFPRRFLK